MQLNIQFLHFLTSLPGWFCHKSFPLLKHWLKYTCYSIFTEQYLDQYMQLEPHTVTNQLEKWVKAARKEPASDCAWVCYLCVCWCHPGWQTQCSPPWHRPSIYGHWWSPGLVHWAMWSYPVRWHFCWCRPSRFSQCEGCHPSQTNTGT